MHAGYLRLYTLKICNTYCFSTGTAVTRTRLMLRLYVHCLSCSFSKPPKTWLRAGLSEEVKWPRTWRRPLTTIKCWKNEWSYISTSPYAFTELYLITGRDNLYILPVHRTETNTPESLPTILKSDWSQIRVSVYLLWIGTHQLHDAVNGSVVSVTQPLHAVVATTHKTQVAGYFSSIVLHIYLYTVHLTMLSVAQLVSSNGRRFVNN
jgi:hypothetical protein